MTGKKMEKCLDSSLQKCLFQQEHLYNTLSLFFCGVFYAFTLQYLESSYLNIQTNIFKPS